MKPYDFFCLVEKYFIKLEKFHQYHNEGYRESANRVAHKIKAEIKRVREIQKNKENYANTKTF